MDYCIIVTEVNVDGRKERGVNIERAEEHYLRPSGDGLTQPEDNEHLDVPEDMEAEVLAIVDRLKALASGEADA